MVDGIFKV